MKKALLSAVFALCGLIVLCGCGNNSGATNGSGGSGGGGSTGGGGGTAQNALLNGKYAFTLSGSTTTDLSPIYMAGTFTADGRGNITAGEEDINQVNGNGTSFLIKAVAISGTYTIGTDGRGTLSITKGETQTFKFALETNGQGQMVRFDTGATGSGTFYAQNTSAFSLSAIQGTYAFNWSGADASVFPIAAVGAFGLGSSGTISTGAADLNDDSNNNQFAVTGTFVAPDSSGHGTATIKYGTNTLSYGYDIISASRLLLIEMDNSAGTIGEADAQTSALTANSLGGSYAFQLAGVDGFGLVGIVGQLGITAGSGSIGSSDVVENDGGAVPAGTTLAGSYALATTVASTTVSGRFTLAATDPGGGSDTFVVYLVSPSEAFVMETDAIHLMAGELLAQSQSPYSSSSFTGNYGLNFTGVDAQQFELDVAGQIASSGTATLTGGTVDINDEDSNGATTFPNNAISGGQYTVQANTTGKSNLSFTAGGVVFQFWFYFVSPNQVFLLEDDSNFVSFGSAFSQPAIPQ